MNKYTNGKEVINATEKAYEVIYKAKGYVPFVAKKEEKPKIEPKKVDNSTKK